MKTTLFVVPGSHPSIAVAQMLEQKGITFRQIDLAPAIHRLVLRVLDFPGVTVPALVIESTRLQGSRRISRALDALRPEPRLFPTQPVRRAEVERAEAWGDLVLQDVPRRLAWWSLRRHPDAVESFMEGARLGVPSDVAAASAGPLIRLRRA